MMHTDLPGLTGGTNGNSSISWGTLGSDTTGLFRLDKLGYTNSYFWLASPNPDYDIEVYYVYCSGGVGPSSSANGVRPVVSMSGVTMQKTTTTDGTTLWKITN